MAQVGRVRAERDTLDAEEEASQNALSAAVRVLQNAIEGLLREHHEFTARHSKVAELLRDTASAPAGRRAKRRESSTDESHSPLCKRARASQEQLASGVRVAVVDSY